MFARSHHIFHAELWAKANISDLWTATHSRHHRHSHSQLVLIRSMGMEALPQLVLDCNITSLIGIELDE